MFDEIFTTINNGTGMKEITSRINEMINTLGTTDFKESNLTRGEKNGFVLLADLAARGGLQPELDGLFKSELVSKDQEPQIMAALRYVYTNLTPSEQALLKTKTGNDRDAMMYIYDLYSAKSNVTKYITNEPFAGKASSGSGGAEVLSDIKSNPLARMMMGEGGQPGRYTIVTAKDDKGFSVDSMNYGKAWNVNEDCNLDEFLTKSQID